MNKYFSLLIVTIFTFSCVSVAQKRAKKPAWIDQPYEAYDKEKFLLAVGYSDDIEGAQKKALGNLSRTFRASVRANQSLYNEIREVTRNGQLTVENNSRLSSLTRITSTEELINTQLYESFTDKNGFVYALVGLERIPTARILDGEIQANVEEIESLNLKSDSEKNPVRVLNYLKTASLLIKANKQLNDQKEIILARPIMDMNTDTYKEVDEKLNSQIQKTKIYFNAKENVPEDIISAIASNLQKEGYDITQNKDEAAILVNTMFESNPVDLGRDDAKFVKWDLSVEMIDVFENRPFFTFQEESRDGARDQKQANLRAIFNAKKKINRTFNRKLSAQLTTY